MKATGVIHIIAELQAFPVYAPGTVMCERMDGKGKEERVFTRTNDGYVLTIPLTEDNIVIAKAFWLRRFCKVLVDHQPIEIPFKEEEYEEWLKADKKILADKAKELKKAEAELDKYTATIKPLLAEVEKHSAIQQASEFDANIHSKPRPAPSKAFTEAIDSLNAAKAKGDELQAKIEQIKGEMQ